MATTSEILILKDKWETIGEGKFSTDKLVIKLMEEVGELASGIVKKNREDVLDAIGDCSILLEFIADQYDTTRHNCACMAYETVRHREGRMVDGIFVKASDLR